MTEPTNMNQHTEALAPNGMPFYDAVTVGERGQVVIPQAAREMLGLKQGTKLLVMGGGAPGALLLIKADMLTALLRGIVERLGGLEKILTEPGTLAGAQQTSAAPGQLEAKDRPETP